MKALIAAVLSVALGAAPALAADFPDLSYGPDPMQTLDLHVPDGGQPSAVVLYFHGGAFVGGDKHPCAPRLVTLLAQSNIAFACANYRLAPQVRYPVPMLDGARALQWLRAHAGEYRLDPSRFGLMGLSAGAGIAMWIAFRPDLASPNSADPVLRQSTSVSAVVTNNAQATYDQAEIKRRLHSSHLPKWLADLYGAESVQALQDARFKAAQAEASPIANMHAGEPPLLAYYGASPERLQPDSAPQAYVHSPEQGAILAEVARERGAEVTLKNDAGDGWQGFLREAVGFFGTHLSR